MNFEQIENPHTIAAALGRDRDVCDDRHDRVAIAVDRQARQADAFCRIRARAHPRTRARQAQCRRQQEHPLRVQGLHAARRRPLQPEELARHRQIQGPDADGPGYRGAQAEVAFLFFRLVSPAVFLVIGALYFFVIAHFTWAITLKIAAVIGCAYFGIKAPEIYISNTIKKRQQSVSRAFPDAMGPSASSASNPACRSSRPSAR